MRRFAFVLATASLAAACGGHTSAPAGPAAPAAAPAARATAPAGDPTTLRLGAGNGRYRLEQVLHSSQEVMGQTTESDATLTMWVSAAVAATEGGNLSAAFTIDSVSATGSVPGATDAVAALRGKTFRAVVTPQGRNVSFTAPDSSDASGQTGQLFREFLPSLPGGTLAPGLSWTDTVSQSQSARGGLSMQTRSIRTHQLGGWETRDGVRALRITTSGSYTITGAGDSQGQQLQLNGTGAAASEAFVSAAGAYLDATGRDSTNLTVLVVSAGLEVPVRQVRRSTVTRLP